MRQTPQEPPSRNSSPQKGATTEPTSKRGLGRRLFWFISLWVMGVLAIGAVSLVLRSLFKTTN